MSATTVWLTLFLAGLLTFLTRLSFIALWGRWAPPEWLRRSLRFVPPAVLTAIILPELLIREAAFTPLNPRLFAGVVAVFVAWRTKNIVWTIGVGMGVLLLLQLFWH